MSIPELPENAALTGHLSGQHDVLEIVLYESMTTASSRGDINNWAGARGGVLRDAAEIVELIEGAIAQELLLPNVSVEMAYLPVVVIDNLACLYLTMDVLSMRGEISDLRIRGLVTLIVLTRVILMVENLIVVALTAVVLLAGEVVRLDNAGETDSTRGPLSDLKCKEGCGSGDACPVPGDDLS